MRYKVKIFFHRVTQDVRPLSTHHTETLEEAKKYTKSILNKYDERVVLYYILDNETNRIVTEYEQKEKEEEIDFGF